MPRTQSNALERQTIHALLSSGVRRAVLCRIRQVGRTTAPALGRYVTDRPGTARGAGRQDRRTATIALIHNHLPRLDAHDVVEYDRSENVVTPGPSFGTIEPFVDRLERVDVE